MPHAKGMHPGAVWKKCDFQVHTPAIHSGKVLVFQVEVRSWSRREKLGLIVS